MVIPIVINVLCTVIKGLVKRLDHLEIRERVDTIQIAEIGQNTEKSPENSRRLVVIQTPVKNSQGINVNNKNINEYENSH